MTKRTFETHQQHMEQIATAAAVATKTTSRSTTEMQLQRRLPNGQNEHVDDITSQNLLLHRIKRQRRCCRRRLLVDRRVCFAANHQVFYYDLQTNDQTDDHEEEEEHQVLLSKKEDCSVHNDNNKNCSPTNNKAELLLYVETLCATYLACHRPQEPKPAQQQHIEEGIPIPILTGGGVVGRGVEGCFVPHLTRARRDGTRLVVRRIVRHYQQQQQQQQRRQHQNNDENQHNQFSETTSRPHSSSSTGSSCCCVVRDDNDDKDELGSLARRLSRPAVEFARILGVADSRAALEEYRTWRRSFFLTPHP